jgi:hypothetical protein
MKISNDIHQIPKLEDADLIEAWNEEEKIAIKKPVASAPAPPKAEGTDVPTADVDAAAPEKPVEQKTEQGFEIKQRVKSVTSTLKFETQGHALPPNARQVYQQAEANFTTSDRSFLDMKEARNDLESLSYEFREALGENGKFLANTTPDIGGPFHAELCETVEWLYGAGENATLEEL